MGLRVIRVMAFLALLVCAGGAYYWFHVKHESAGPALASGPVYQPIKSAPLERTIPRESPSFATSAPAAVDAKKSNELPVRPGEVLEFSASMAKLNNVANLRLQVDEHRDFLGKSAWHLQAFAHTENPLRMVFLLDDQFDSYSDASSMASLQYEMHLNERG